MNRKAQTSIATLALCLAAACSHDPEPTAASTGAALEAGHAEMVERLRDVQRRLGPEHQFLGDALLEFKRRRVTTLSESTPARQRIAAELEVAHLELRLGQTDAALERLNAAMDRLPAVPSSERPIVEVGLLRELAVGYLRLGENRNCVNCTNGYGCLFPIQPQGVHQDREGSERARDYLLALIDHPAADDETRLVARWLLNIAAMTLGEFPGGVPAEYVLPPSAVEADAEFPRFPEVAASKGLNSLTLSGAAIVDDLDGDGALDVMSSGYDLEGEVRVMRGDGHGAFTDVTESAGLKGYPGGLNMISADYDNDGDLDVYVLRGGWQGKTGRYPNSLLQNDGHGRFYDVTLAAGLLTELPTQAGAWGDVDNDGDLDLFVGNEEFPSQLFQNRGDGTFVDVAEKAGVLNDRYAKAAVFGDYDGDRDLDLYVSNHRGQNRLYENQGDGTFVDVAGLVGVERPLLSFSAWFFDYDNDGNLDLFVAGYVERLAVVAASYLGLPHDGEPARLYRGDGQGGFTDVTSKVGLDRRVVVTMGANFGDLDNDGWLDLYLGTGWPSYEALVPNVMYHNVEGRRFDDVSAAGGFGHLQKGHAVVFADMDGDGDQDVFEQMGGAFAGDRFQDALYENPGFGRHWIDVKLEGVRSNRSAIGARIKAEFVEEGVRRRVYRQVGTGGSFGANPLRQHIGVGAATEVERLEVFWPTTGQTQVLEHLAVDRLHHVKEG